MLRRLVDNYFETRINRVEYLIERRNLMDQIDREFNQDFLEPDRENEDQSPVIDASSNTIARDREEFGFDDQ